MADHSTYGGAHPALRHHFDDLTQQHESAQLGMWLFLLTEIMFFGGLFTGYAVYRFQFPEAFQAASHHLNVTLGAANTVVLILSSLTMALSVHSAQSGKKRALIAFLILTVVLGCVFLGVKGFEYHDKYVNHLIPGKDFQWEGDPAYAKNAPLYYCFYFGMTGLHAVHMIIGIVILLVLVKMAANDKFTTGHYTMVEMSGLYWHFVDIVWIFLFPLLYLIGRHAK